jgi:hypothetical protein
VPIALVKLPGLILIATQWRVVNTPGKTAALATHTPGYLRAV